MRSIERRERGRPARDRECLPAYHFANADTRVQRQSAVICELIRDAGRNTDPDITDLFGRARTPQEIAPLPRLAKALGRALWRGEQPRLETLRRAAPELRTELMIRHEQRLGRFRSTRPITGSEHPGAEWPPAPVAGAPSPRPSEAVAMKMLA